eukprot:gnl/TRDRNA2_/TRDRNA2_158136_c1_seq1.p1 gnl/TRDRNA2_/TRDRNA2_158136_c1~~gnl/TRDRNA2_/TRDRNA2_158136_c1_seq1.p1  ORF type:complete len:797 (-),score=127.62 gnl/TRDRNA2_/TRDRNA2_158136_c1_seq1:60-2189(-)
MESDEMKEEVAKLEKDITSTVTIVERLERSFAAGFDDFAGISHDIDQQQFDPKWSANRKLVAKTLASFLFEGIMTLVILANIMVVINETDKRALCEDKESLSCEANSSGIRAANNVFLAIYSIELVMRMYAFRWTFHRDLWNVFDFAIVVVSLLSEFLSSSLGSWKVLRVFRMARIVRVFRLLASFRELYLMINGLVSALKTMFWACVLLVLILCIVSILAVDFLHPLALRVANGEFELFEDACPRCDRMFSSVWNSTITFFQTVIMGDAWGEVTLPLIDADPASAIFLLPLVIAMSLGFSNLIVAVIVEKAGEARLEDMQFQLMTKRREEARFKEKFVALCEELDDDASGTLTLKELISNFETNRHFKSLLTSINVDKHEMVSAFEIMDSDRTGSITYNDFSDTLFKMKTADTTTMLTFIKFYVLQLRRDMKVELNEINTLLSSFGLSDAAASPTGSPSLKASTTLELMAAFPPPSGPPPSGMPPSASREKLLEPSEDVPAQVAGSWQSSPPKSACSTTPEKPGQPTKMTTIWDLQEDLDRMVQSMEDQLAALSGIVDAGQARAEVHAASLTQSINLLSKSMATALEPLLAASLQIAQSHVNGVNGTSIARAHLASLDRQSVSPSPCSTGPPAENLLPDALHSAVQMLRSNCSNNSDTFSTRPLDMDHLLPVHWGNSLPWSTPQAAGAASNKQDVNKNRRRSMSASRL